MKRAVLVGVIVAVIICGCVVPSIHGIATKENKVWDESLLGVWGEPNDPNHTELWFVEKGLGDKMYDVAYVDSTGAVGRFDVALAKIGSMRILDIYPKGSGPVGNRFYDKHWIPARNSSGVREIDAKDAIWEPTHTFARVYEVGDKLRLRTMAPDKMKSVLEKEPSLKHEYADEEAVLAAGTADLVEFVRKHPDDIWADEKTMVRGNSGWLPGAVSMFNLGLTYENEKDYMKAIKWYTKAAEQGHTDAQNNLGLMYERGQGVTQDYKEAVKWYTRAAELGNAMAQCNLGLMYEKGQGVVQDYREAVKWYRKAAEQGNSLSQFALGNMYCDGNGVVQDYREAVKWYTKAAEQGDTSAQVNLGTRYWLGQGVTEDYVQAYKWIILAAAQGQELAIKKKDVLREKLSSSQVAEAQRLAREWKPKDARSEKSKAAKEADTVLTPKTTGTGFFITGGGIVVTARHIVKDAAKIEVVTAKGMKDAKLLREDVVNDIALLKVDGEGYRALTVAPSKRVKVSDEVFTIGFPNIGLQGFEPKYTKGYISSLSGIQDDPRYFQISTPVQPGNSGGPLVDSNGNVVGVVVAKLDDATTIAATGSVPQNVNYAVKSSLLLNLVESLLAVSEKMPEAKAPSEKPVGIVEEVMQGVVLVVVR